MAHWVVYFRIFIRNFKDVVAQNLPSDNAIGHPVAGETGRHQAVFMFFRICPDVGQAVYRFKDSARPFGSDIIFSIP